jgi:Metallo-beta-lactamase superfamily
VDVIELLPRLYFIRLPIGHAYLWSDPDGLTLIDAGLPGSAPLLADAIHQTGHELADLRHLVLTHFHADHIGAASDIAEWGEVEVLAHHADAPFIRAAATGPAPDLADWEQPVYEQVMSSRPCRRFPPAIHGRGGRPVRVLVPRRRPRGGPAASGSRRAAGCPMEAGGGPGELRGAQQIMDNSARLNADYQIHGVEIDDPFVRDDRFAVRFAFDQTHLPTGKREKAVKVSLSTVAGAAIVREEVFYHTPPHALRH